MLVINEVDQSHLGDGSCWMMLELKNHVERKAITVVFFFGGCFHSETLGQSECLEHMDEMACLVTFGES